MSHQTQRYAESQSPQNFALPWPLTLLTVLEALILLIAALQLYHFPRWEGLRWPWALRPYNAVFLGGIYWAAFATVGFQILVRRWSTARLVQPMILIFSAVLLSVSLAHLGLFNWQRRLVKAWFLVYTVVPFSAAFVTFIYRDRPAAPAVQLPSRYQKLLTAKAVCLGLYGLALLIAPELSTAFWPWPITPFHASLYSAIFLATALGNGLLSRSATAMELWVLGVAELLLGALPCFGILRLNQIVGAMDWSQPGSILWLTLLGAWAIVGLQLIRQALRWRKAPQA